MVIPKKRHTDSKLGQADYKQIPGKSNQQQKKAFTGFWSTPHQYSEESKSSSSSEEAPIVGDEADDGSICLPLDDEIGFVTVQKSGLSPKLRTVPDRFVTQPKSARESTNLNHQSYN